MENSPDPGQRRANRPAHGWGARPKRRGVLKRDLIARELAPGVKHPYAKIRLLIQPCHMIALKAGAHGPTDSELGRLEYGPLHVPPDREG